MRDEENEMTMIERVARAIQEARTAGTQDWRRVNSVTLARAAIEAMREPTDEMIDSAYTCDPEDGVYVEYQAMIDEALSE